MKKILSNIVFTKNRPLQLHAYLKSFLMHFPSDKIQVYVLYKPELFDSEYQQVFDEFPECCVIREKNFHDDFVRLMEGLKTEYVNFGTDDVVYFDSVNIDTIWAAFGEAGSDIFGFSLRMSPQTICESNIDLRTINNVPVYSVNWKTTRDQTAGYPFELNGTVYKTALVQDIFAPVSKEHPIQKWLFFESWFGKLILLFSSLKNFKAYVYTYRNPNSLEGFCARWCKTHKKQFPSYLFFQKLCASAIQVNIVNTEVENPIDGGNDYTVESLNEKFKHDFRFDIDCLINNPPNQTHIGRNYFVLKQG